MKFAKWTFRIAGVYGVLGVLPLYFSESQIGRDSPPAITHPEYFYGFIGVALAWQVLFLLLARDPVRYRVMMLPAVLEKAGYGIAVLVLHAQDRVPSIIFASAFVDLTLGALFVAAYAQTGGTSF